MELSRSLCTICGARDPSPLIGYVRANTIPTVTLSMSVTLTALSLHSPARIDQPGRPVQKAIPAQASSTSSHANSSQPSPCSGPLQYQQAISKGDVIWNFSITLQTPKLISSSYLALVPSVEQHGAALERPRIFGRSGSRTAHPSDRFECMNSDIERSGMRRRGLCLPFEITVASCSRKSITRHRYKTSR